MRVISIINLKGGVGKTSTAANMGYILNRVYGASVLLLGNDKQGNLSKAYGMYQDSAECDTARLLRGEYRDIKELVQHIPGYDGMDIVRANMTLLTSTWELNRTDADDQIERYRPLLEARTEKGKTYDFLIIDNPPDLGLNVINALNITNDVIVPTKIDQWALEGLDIIDEQIGQMKQVNTVLTFMGALVTMYQNDDANNAGLEWLRESKYQIFDTCIRFSRKATESTFFDRPVTEYSPRSGAARGYKQFVDEYLDKINYKGVRG